MKENNKIYTAADFARYHAGTMPADEMHALEKAALEDPFLEDALEGYVYTAAEEGDIEELRSRLSEKTKKKNIFFLSSVAQNKWWRIAALFVLTGGAGYLFYNISYVGQKNPIAKIESKTAVEKKDTDMLLKADSTPAKNDIAFENLRQSKPAQKEKEPPLSITRKIKKPVDPESWYKPAPNQNYMSTLSDSSYAFSPTSKDGDKEKDNLLAKKIKRYELKGKVTDEKGAPLAYATISERSSKNGTLADSAGRFSFYSPDSSITAVAAATGFASKTFNLKKDKQAIISMDKSNAALDEVVVVGYGSKSKRAKKRNSSSNALEGKVAGVQITPDSAIASIRQEKFDRYLKENTPELFDDDNNERLSGEVVLSFTINKKGRPKNIKVIKSTCEACEPDAIKLLQNGPSWTGKAESYRIVIIPFLKND